MNGIGIVQHVVYIVFNVILFLDMYCVRSYKMKPRIVTTKYGNCTGMIITFQGHHLHPVEVFSGFQYSSTRGNIMRFIPPASSLEKWLGNRIFSNMNYRGVCPQHFSHIKNASVNKASQYVNILRRLEPYSVIQAEDCLMLNIYVPFKGRLRDKITHNYHCYYALDKIDT